MVAWGMWILFLTALAIFSWLFPAYVFRNPQIPFNYQLLQKIGKLEEIKAFSERQPPPQSERKFFKATELFEQVSGRPADKLALINDLQKRLYIQNYQTGEMLGYVTGRFRVLATRPLTKEDFFTGIAVRMQSVVFPNVEIEYLIPTTESSAIPYETDTEVEISTSGHLAVILHMTHLPNDRLRFSVVSLCYENIRISEESEITVAPPSAVNLRAEWPAFPAAS